MDFDDVFERVGGYGKFQKRLLLISFLFGIPSGFNTINTVFTHDVSEHHCNINSSHLSDDSLNDSIPFETDAWGRTVPSSCFQFNNTSAKQVIPCEHGWKYTDKKMGFVSVANEYDLVCDKAIITSTIESLFLGARGVSMLLAGFFADRYGRRIVFLVALIVQNIAVILASVSTNLWMYTAMIVIYGGTGPPTYLSCYNLVSELTGHKWRNRVNIFLNSGYVFGYMLFALYGYLAPHWRHLLRYVALTGVLVIPLVRFIPESPRWSVSKNKTKAGLKVLAEIAKENKMDIDVKALEKECRNATETIGIDEQPKQQTSSLYQFLRNRKFIAELCVLLMCWMFTNITYYGLALNSSSFGGDRYVNCFLSGAMEFPAVLITYIMMEKVGRPYTVASTLMFGGIFCVVSPFVKPASVLLSSLFAIAGKSGLTGTFYAIIGLTPEMTPTLIRNTVTGICSSSSKLGAFISPYIMYIGKTVHPRIPFLIMGVGAITSGILTLFIIPETKNKNLPSTMNDAMKLRPKIGCLRSSKHEDEDDEEEKVELNQEKLNELNA